MSTIFWMIILTIVILFAIGAISFTDKGMAFLKAIQAIIDKFFGKSNTPKDEGENN